MKIYSERSLIYITFQVPLVSPDSLDTREVLARKEQQAVRDNPGQWGCQETKDPLVLLELLVSLVLLDSLAVQELLAQLEQVDSQDCKVPLVQLELLDFQVTPDPQETLDLSAALELQEQLDHQALRELLAYQVLKAIKGQLD
jgi:hypothetical protein